MAHIHPTAIVEKGAEIGPDVTVGPHCCVGSRVVIEAGARLVSHVVVDGRTRIGPRTEIYPFASIGLPPQDLKYRGEDSELIIGADNRIREHVTINPGTEGGGMVTRIGNHCLLMVGAHVAHDCQVGDHVILVNNATLAGHVTIEEGAIIGGLSAVHQFARVGRHAMVGGMSGLEGDLIPYGMAIGNRARLSGLNIVGLKRRQVSRETLRRLREAYRCLFAREGTLAQRLAQVSERFSDCEPAMQIVEFIGTGSSRALCQPDSDDIA